jgi:hypothetical protein
MPLMGFRWRLSKSLVAAAAVGFCASPACAWFPHFRSAPRAAYAPQVQQYVVVSPTPLATSGGGQHGGGAAAGQILWQETTTPVPAYPWGWFGTRATAQPMTHTGIYGDYRDHKLMGTQ